MQAAPFLNEAPSVWPRPRGIDSHDLMGGRHDADQRVGPVRNEHRRSQEPRPIACLPPRPEAQEKAGDRERRLHGEGYPKAVAQEAEWQQTAASQPAGSPPRNSRGRTRSTNQRSSRANAGYRGDSRRRAVSAALSDSPAGVSYIFQARRQHVTAWSQKEDGRGARHGTKCH